MTVINPNSISGITSITLPSGGDNVLTIHTNDGTERFRIDSSGNVKIGTAATISPDGDLFVTGVCTATTLSGAASGLTGALPAIDGSALTGIAATDNVRTGILDVAGIATFRNDVNIGAAVTISESGIEASGIGITCANINGGQISGRRNLIINGDMRIAQYGTSSTSLYYQTIDRFRTSFGNIGSIDLTQSQQQLTSSDTPYSSGFRYFYRAALSGAGTVNTNGYIGISQRLEAQDVAQSGWDYTSASSDVTIQFWFRCSTNQTFYMALTSQDGTSQSYVFAFTASGNNTWTKIVKTIPGAANVQFDLNNERGLTVSFTPWYGTDYTGSKTVNAWSAYSSSAEYPDYASTWLTAGASTFDITGVQLEVGSQATPFEHRSFGEELALCHRYAYVINVDSGDIVDRNYSFTTSSSNMDAIFYMPTPMRSKPTYTGTATDVKMLGGNSTASFNLNTIAALYASNGNDTWTGNASVSGTADKQPGVLYGTEDNGKLIFSAEI